MMQVVTGFELNSIAMQHIVILGVVLGYVKQYNAIHIFFLYTPWPLLKEYPPLPAKPNIDQFFPLRWSSKTSASDKNHAFSLSKPKNS